MYAKGGLWGGLCLLVVLAAGCSDDAATDTPALESMPNMQGTETKQDMQGLGGAGMGAEDTPKAMGTPTGAKPLPGPSRLSQGALDELADLGAMDFIGKATVLREETMGDAVKVTFDPDSGPICLRGAEFAAYYRDRGSDKTMILLDGGGACWSALCAATAMIAPKITSIGPASAAEGNPFADWNLVHVPYCDGSVFSGDAEFAEMDGTTRYHHGRQNLAAGLDLALTHFGDSKKIMIGGFSAGGYGTLSGMIALRIAFPQVDLYVMNDSGPGVQNGADMEAIGMRLDEWGHGKYIPPSCTGCMGGYGQQTQIIEWFLDNDPTVKVSMLSYYEDNVIGMAFNMLSGPEYKELLLTETDKIHEAHPDRFKRYMLPGTKHVVSAGWANITADGVKESDWVNAMVNDDDSVWTDLLATGP